MRSFLRDLAFLALFGASVAAVVLVIAIHQGHFSFDPAPSLAEPADPESPIVQETRALAALAPNDPSTSFNTLPVEMVPGGPALSTPPPRGASPSNPAFAPTMSAGFDAETTPAPFNPATRGVMGDARVLCAPEITWLQDQLSTWASEGRSAVRVRPSTLVAAHAAARRASAFSYEVSPECWNDPATIESRGWGDCADKSLWLARELLHAGYPMVGIRLGVPENYLPGQPGHAWVVLYHHGSEWIYDPAASPRLTSQDSGPTKRFRITATVFPRVSHAVADTEQTAAARPATSGKRRR